MAADSPKINNPEAQQLIAQWREAQEQFQALREAVEYAARLSQLKEQADFLGREREAALKSLGEAVWQEVRRNHFELPRTMSTRLRALEALEQQRSAQAAEISALLAEGEEAATRLRKKPPPVQSPVARPLKKR